MVKNIELNEEKTITLSNSVGWMRKYKTQFGRDIVPTIIPALNAAIEVVVNMMKATGGKSVKDTKALTEALDVEVLQSAIYDIAGLEMTDLINVVWAMAKQADKEVGTPEEWEDELPCFPLDVILPALFELLTSCFLTEKNLKRVQTAIETLRP